MPLWTCVIFKVIARDSALAQLDTVRLSCHPYDSNHRRPMIILLTLNILKLACWS